MLSSQILSFPVKDDRITVNQSALNGKNYLHVGGDVAKQIWIPDIIIDKVRETNDLEKKENSSDERHSEPKPGEGGELDPPLQGQHRGLLLEEELRPCMWDGQSFFFTDQIVLVSALKLSFLVFNLILFSSSRTSASSPSTTRPASWSSTPMAPPPRTTPSSGAR